MAHETTLPDAHAAPQGPLLVYRGLTFLPKQFKTD